MTRAKTQGPGGKPPRAATQSGGKPKRAITHSNLFNDLEAAIDSLDQSSARHSSTKTPDPDDKPKLPAPKRAAPGPSPDGPKAPRTVPPKPPPGAERAAVIRARESRAASEIAVSEISVDDIDEAATVPSPRVPPRPPPGTRPPPMAIPAPPPRSPIPSAPRPTATRPLDADGLPPISAPPTRATPRPAAAEAVPVHREPEPSRPIGQPQPSALVVRFSEEADAAPARPARPDDDADLPVARAPAPARPVPRPEMPPIARAVPEPARPVPRPEEKPIARAPLPRPEEPPIARAPLPVPKPPIARAPLPRTPEPSRPVVRPSSDFGADESPLDDAAGNAKRPFTLDLDESGSMPEPESGLSIDIDLEESQAAARAYDSGPVRALSDVLAEADDDDQVDAEVVDPEVVEGDALPSIEPLSIAILDDPPYIAAAKQAIAVAGHRVAAAASGQAGIEQIKSLLRTGIAEVLLVGVPGGEELIDTALALAPRRPIVIAAIGGKPADVVRKAVVLGVDLAVARPLDVDKLAPVLLAASRLATARSGVPVNRGSEANMRGRLDALADHEPGTLQSFDAFERVFDLEVKRSKRYGYPIAIALFAVGVDGEPPPGMLGIVRARAGNALIQSIRDIDLATEVEDRFLVLLPYTTLGGAAEVARRILGAVNGGTPIKAGGKTYPPRIVGAVAGAQKGEPLSFSRLIREATQALEEARRDGAELAVPMGTRE